MDTSMESNVNDSNIDQLICDSGNITVGTNVEETNHYFDVNQLICDSANIGSNVEVTDQCSDFNQICDSGNIGSNVELTDECSDLNQICDSGNVTDQYIRALRYCMVRGCYNSTMTRPDLKYLIFPKNPELCKAWIEKCNDPNLLYKGKRSSFRVCSEHFLPTDFNPPWKRLTLKRNTIPSVFNNLMNKPSLDKIQHPQSMGVESELSESLGAELDFHSYSVIPNESSSTPYNADCDSTRPVVESSRPDVNKIVEVEKPTFEFEVNSCRLCLQLLGEKPGCLWRNCEFTELGYKFRTITEVEESHYYVFKTLHCCHECALKIQVCFSLYLEIRTMETILVKHYSENALLQKDRQLMKCYDCMEDVLGIQAFIEHTKQHIIHGSSEDNEDEVIGDEDNESQEKNKEDGQLNEKICKTKKLDEYFYDQFAFFTSMEKQVLYDEFINVPSNDDDSDDNDDDEVIDIIKFELDYHDDTDDDDVFKDNIEVKHDKYICPKCTQCFDYKFELRYHLVRHDSAYWTTTDILGVVPENNREVKKKLALLQRREKRLMKKKETTLSLPKVENIKRKGQTWCRYCNELFFRGSVFSSHVQQCRSEFKKQESILCDFCGLFIDPHSYKEHFKKHWEERSHIRRQKEAKGICLKCNKHFSKSLKNHKPCYDPDTSVCVQCGQSVPKNKMSDHIKRKHGNNQAKFDCPICERRFIYEYEVDAHLLRHEDYDTPFEIICRRCSLHITDLKHFQLHLVNDHFYNHKRVKQCDHCEKRFVILQEYNDHLMNEHGVPRETIKEKCQKCNKCFPIIQIAAHRIKCSKKKTKLQCPLCYQKAFTDRTMDLHLLKHKNMNIPLKRTCSVCKINFEFLTDFQKHVALFHVKKRIRHRNRSKKIKKIAAVEVSETNQSSQHSEEMEIVLYECQYCEVCFMTSEMLVEHKMAYHQAAAQGSAVKKDNKKVFSRSNSQFNISFFH